MSIGLDIGSKSIKVVELEKKGSNWSLKSSGVVGYSGMSLENAQNEKDLAPLSEIIKKLFKESRISSRDVFLALPERFAFVKVVTFPLLTDQEIDAALKWEADQYIPIPLEEAVMQYQVILRDENSTPPQVKVLLVAARRSLLEKYVLLAQLSGLQVLAIENEMMSLARLISMESNLSAVVNFGASSTDIGMIKDGKLWFSRSIPTGGDALTRSIVQSLRIEPLQAEEYKKTYGLSNKLLEGRVRSAMEPVMRSLVEEINKAIQYFVSENSQLGKPKQLIISGGLAGLPDLMPYLTKEFDMEILLSNPFLRITVPPESQKLVLGYAPFYSVAAGLAMRED
jgi:type IV pilus assembly protein PilM